VKYTDATVEQVRAAWAAGMGLSEIARRFRMPHSTVFALVHNLRRVPPGTPRPIEPTARRRRSGGRPGRPPRLSPEVIREIRSMAAAGIPPGEIARLVGAHPTYVVRIIDGRARASVAA